MFDIGIGEVLALAVVGLLIFGPERLPKAAADAGRWVRQIREMAGSARKELSESAGVDLTGTMDTFKEFRDLHPKRLASGMFDDDLDTEPRPASSGTSDDGPEESKPRQTFDPDIS